ncbi:hypothetical protein C2E23DRAFT_845227 [Lenzites betulinus]|nr:hypothetical protein C2E23DRAFT_845227 [Lenzites betulinus]
MVHSNVCCQEAGTVIHPRISAIASIIIARRGSYSAGASTRIIMTCDSPSLLAIGSPTLFPRPAQRVDITQADVPGRWSICYIHHTTGSCLLRVSTSGGQTVVTVERRSGLQRRCVQYKVVLMERICTRCNARILGGGDPPPPCTDYLLSVYPWFIKNGDRTTIPSPVREWPCRKKLVLLSHRVSHTSMPIIHVGRIVSQQSATCTWLVCTL